MVMQILLLHVYGSRLNHLNKILTVAIIFSTYSTNNWAINIKGYLRYKTITSQDVPSEAQVKNFFFMEKLCSVLEIFKFLYF